MRPSLLNLLYKTSLFLNITSQYNKVMKVLKYFLTKYFLYFDDSKDVLVYVASGYYEKEG